MKIHSTAKFENKVIPFHNEFEVNFPIKIILENKEKVASMAIGNFKKKCDDYFKVKFSTMIFFECYLYDLDGKEIEIFKKVKE